MSAQTYVLFVLPFVISLTVAPRAIKGEEVVKVFCERAEDYGYPEFCPRPEDPATHTTCCRIRNQPACCHARAAGNICGVYESPSFIERGLTKKHRQVLNHYSYDPGSEVDERIWCPGDEDEQNAVECCYTSHLHCCHKGMGSSSKWLILIMVGIILGLCVTGICCIILGRSVYFSYKRSKEKRPAPLHWEEEEVSLNS